MSPRRLLDKLWLRRRAHRFKPATDVHLGVSFTAVMPGSGGAGGFRIPPVHGKVGISTSNYEPVGGARGNESANFTPEFLQCCHAFCSVDSVILTQRLGLVAKLSATVVSSPTYSVLMASLRWPRMLSNIHQLPSLLVVAAPALDEETSRKIQALKRKCIPVVGNDQISWPPS